MPAMHVLAWLLAAAVIAAIWWNALGAKKSARQAARRACRDAEVRFIDELALQKLGPGRARHRSGRRPLCLRRVYRFEFYWGGEVRYTGYVTMHGQTVASVQLDPYPL